jgi:three-Cys-motif partner protein
MSKNVIWEADPHTLTKIEILGRYLEAWYGILGRSFGRVFYIDAFAGPGEYKGQISGSPLVALDKALRHPVLKDREATFWFVEQEATRFQYLNALVAQRQLPENFQVYVWNCSSTEALKKILQELGCNDRRAPTFAFIDPYGVKGVSMSQLHQLLKKPSCEVMVTHMVQFFNRFKVTPEFEKHMDEFYGTRDWREAPDQGTSFLVDLFQRQLRKQASFTWSFRVIDRKNQHLYDLVFATNNIKGLEKMKDAMASEALDPYSMSDRTAWQGTLFSFWDDIAPLKKQLHQESYKFNQFSVHQLVEWALIHTDYRRKDIRKALLELVTEDVLTVTTKDGNRARRGTVPPDAIIEVKREV